MRSIIKDKRAGFTDLFLFMIFSFIIVVVSGIFLYIGTITSQQLHAQLDNSSTAEVNYTKILNETTDQIPIAYQVLRWGSAFLIFAMIISIFYGSYKVTTRPIYFIPYFIIVLMAVMLAVVMANAYDELLTDSQVGSTLQTFIASNYMLLYLPYIVAVVGIVGGIIMFASYSLLRQQEISYLG